LLSISRFILWLEWALGSKTQAQNKVVFALLLCLMMYLTAFFILWAFFWFTPVGVLCAASLVWLFAVYHNKLISGTV
jgi:glycerol-3-phosphate O-acyltransferase/dihydroxyacetone phosphate acyltransferase